MKIKFLLKFMMIICYNFPKQEDLIIKAIILNNKINKY